jgi:hypothetical protein
MIPSNERQEKDTRKIMVLDDYLIAAKEIRAESLDFLEPRGFSLSQASSNLPLPNLKQTLRPLADIVGRVMAMQTLFLYVALEEEQERSETLQKYITQNYLMSHFTPEEARVFSLPRTQAREHYQASIGWLLEGIWSLAWVLGYNKKPEVHVREIPVDVTQDIFLVFLPEVGSFLDDFFHRVSLRHVDEVITLEDRFFCALHAFSLSNRGINALPKAFSTPFYESIITERLHALHWSLTPTLPWEALMLSPLKP